MNTVSLLGTASTVLVGGYIFRKTIFSTIEPILFNIYKFNRNYVHPTLIKFRDYDICYRFRLLTAIISGKNINERLTNQNKYQQNGTTIQSIPKHISNDGYMINKSGFYKLIAILNDDFKDKTLLKKPSVDIFLSATIKYRNKEYDIDINKFSILGADIFTDIFIKWYFYYFKGKTIKETDMQNIIVSILDCNVNNIVIDYKKYVHINEDDKEPYYSIKDCN